MYCADFDSNIRFASLMHWYIKTIHRSKKWWNLIIVYTSYLPYHNLTFDVRFLTFENLTSKSNSTFGTFSYMCPERVSMIIGQLALKWAAAVEPRPVGSESAVQPPRPRFWLFSVGEQPERRDPVQPSRRRLSRRHRRMWRRASAANDVGSFGNVAVAKDDPPALPNSSFSSGLHCRSATAL